MLALASAGPACLITEPVGFDDRQIPSHLSGAQPFSFTRVPGVRDQACPGTIDDPDGDDVGPYMAFTVEVSDANVNERLTARLFVNGDDKTGRSIPATGTVARGPVTLCATKDELSEQCNRVELVVSSEFAEGPDEYETADPNDFAKVEWWVLGPAESAPNANQNECTQWLRPEER